MLGVLAPSLEHWRKGLGAARFSKLEVVLGDALTGKVQPAAKGLDYALIDIWPTVGDTAIRKDMKTIARRYGARVYGAWGIEFEFVDWLRKTNVDPDVAKRSSTALYQKFASEWMGMRLVGQDHPEAVQLAMRAVTNQVMA